MTQFLVTYQNGEMIQKIKVFNDHQQAIGYVKKYIKPKSQHLFTVMDDKTWFNIDPRYRNPDMPW